MRNFILIFLIILSITVSFIRTYRFRVFEDEIIDLCNNLKCNDGSQHTMCQKRGEIGGKCKDFELITIKPKTIQSIIMGHNGIRNRVAKDHNKPASNMNYLHWDKDLARMAERWLQQCVLVTDPCDFIYNDTISIGQNVKYVEKFTERRWATSAIRSWFLEGNNFNVKFLDNFRAGEGKNYSQLIWAKTEFVGCSAAKMYGGYRLVCNYHPKGNIPNEAVYKTGKPCTDCSTDRPSCSRIFSGLCGIDDVFSSSTSIDLNNIIKVIIFLIILCILLENVKF